MLIMILTSSNPDKATITECAALLVLLKYPSTTFEKTKDSKRVSLPNFHVISSLSRALRLLVRLTATDGLRI